MAAAEPAEKDDTEFSRVCKVNNEAKDERLNLFSPEFDPALLLRRPLASPASTAADDVALPNIRVAELLLPWGHQPQSIAAARAAAAAALEEEAAGAGAAGAIEMCHGGIKRSAFEAKLNAARNKQLKIELRQAVEASKRSGALASRILALRFTGRLLPERLRNPSKAAGAAATAGQRFPAADAETQGPSLMGPVLRLRQWQQQQQQLEALVHPNALVMLRRSRMDPTSGSSGSSRSLRVRGYLCWFDSHATILLQPAEILAEEPQLQNEQPHRVDWLLIP